MAQERVRVDLDEAVHLHRAENNARTSVDLERHVRQTMIAIDEDVSLHVGKGVAERIEPLDDLRLLRQIEGVIEDLPLLEQEKSADVARVVADGVEAGELNRGELGGRPLVEVDDDVDAVARPGRQDVGRDDVRVEEAAGAVVELDAMDIDLKRERVEVVADGQLAAQIRFVDVAQSG